MGEMTFKYLLAGLAALVLLFLGMLVQEMSTSAKGRWWLALMIASAVLLAVALALFFIRGELA